MSFADPIWLSLTPLLLLFFGGVLVYGLRRRDALLSRFAASRLLEQLTEQAGLTRIWIKSACILMAVAALGLALARPQLGVEWSERKARGLDVVFVLDSSKSMLATDLRPTRLSRAKLAIMDLIERLESDRIGLVAFAGQAFLQTPPTLDYAAFRESLDAIDPGIMTSGGSDLGYALKEAAKAFPSQNNVKVVVLLTDGEDLGGNAVKAAEEAREAGIQVFAIGIGTPEGEYLKISNAQGIEEFVRDADGQPVRSQLDETTLQQIAQITGGSYSRLSGDSLDQLYRSVLATLPREERESELQEIRIERFQWALAVAVALLVFEMLIRRRRSAAIQASLTILALFAFVPADAQAQAQEPQDARSLYNSGYAALQSGDYAAANQLYQSALTHSTDLKLQRDALYNMGHATYQQGRSSYAGGDPQAALEQVGAVREAIEKLIEQQQPPQQEESEDSDQQDEPSDENQDSQQNQDESQPGEPANQSQDPQSGDDSQQQQDEAQPADQSQQDDQSEPGDQSEQDGTDGEPSESQSEPQEPTAEGDASQSAPQESTQDPVDDIPQPQPGEESDPPAEPSEQAGLPEPGEGETGEAPTGGAVSGTPTEGMTEAEAAALLDSLRGKETLLPFINQRRSGQKQDIRDW